MTTDKIIDVNSKNGNLIFNQKMSLKYVDRTVLPDVYWNNIKKIKVLNNNYNLRFSPQIDDSTSFYFNAEPHYGNVIGKLSMNTKAHAIAETTDSTGRVWFFVAVFPEFQIEESLVYHNKDEIKSYQCGWVSSNFVELLN